ncbi:hypothetical protein F4808DRAFT_474727 [Astrocystis sublimbata]|nr:hypothetical protein F4808DRAFT_474716 [Astrocystis sublimbata]KAI0195001.1 hypothetical protein F4808DRAFT_474727 [Astrocystis sublimbata]
MQSIYVASNGDLLVTTIAPTASIWHVSGATTETPTLTRVVDLDYISLIASITGTQNPDVFVFVGGNQTTIGAGVPGTHSVYELDLTNGIDHPIVAERVHMTNASFCVHIEPIPDHSDNYLVSDTKAGIIWQVDVSSGTYEEVLRDKTMAPPAWASMDFGINGAHVHNGYIYYNNGFLGNFYHFAMTDDGHAVPGTKIELVQHVRAVFLDGSTFGPDDSNIIWTASNANNQLIAIPPQGNPVTVLGASDEAVLAGPVGLAFGKLPGDKETLYIVTGGALLNPINGTFVEGGRIIAVDTRGFSFPPEDEL